MDRESWLAERRKGIGASDAAAVCGVSPWGSPLSVYLDKRGLLPSQDSAPMKWGLLLEDVIAAAYVEMTGRVVEKPHDPIWWHDRLPWMFATLDRFTTCGRVVELKTSRSADGWGEPGSDHVPESYIVQVHHQMAVADAWVADIAVLIGGSDFRVYTVERNQLLAERIMEIELAFWRRVQKEEPPDVDWTDPRTPELVQLLHRPVPEKAVDLPEDCGRLLVDYQEAGEAVRHYDRVREEAKARLILAMGDASVGRLPGVEIVRKLVPAKTITYERREYCDFRIRKPKESNHVHDSERADFFAGQGEGAA